jgi:hypothetical protein
LDDVDEDDDDDDDDGPSSWSLDEEGHDRDDESPERGRHDDDDDESPEHGRHDDDDDDEDDDVDDDADAAATWLWLCSMWLKTFMWTSPDTRNDVAALLSALSLTLSLSLSPSPALLTVDVCRTFLYRSSKSSRIFMKAAVLGCFVEI